MQSPLLLGRRYEMGLPKKQNVYLRVPQELKDKLKQMADRQAYRLHSLIIAALWQYAEGKG